MFAYLHANVKHLKVSPEVQIILTADGEPYFCSYSRSSLQKHSNEVHKMILFIYY